MNARAALLLALLAACTPSPKDVVPESRDERGERGATSPQKNPDAYEYVARREHGTIAIAESRGMAKADAQALAEDLADRFEQCALGLEAQGLLVPGAARIIAEQELGWSAPATSLRHAPGGAVAQNALACLVAPLRAMALKQDSPAIRAAIALEAAWRPGGLRGVSTGSNPP